MSKQSHIHSHTIVPQFLAFPPGDSLASSHMFLRCCLLRASLDLNQNDKGVHKLCVLLEFLPYFDLLTSQINLWPLSKAQDISTHPSPLFWEWLLKVPPKVQHKNSAEMPGIHLCLLCFSDPLVHLHSLTGFKWSHFTSSSFHLENRILQRCLYNASNGSQEFIPIL